MLVKSDLNLDNRPYYRKNEWAVFVTVDSFRHTSSLYMTDAGSGASGTPARRIR